MGRWGHTLKWLSSMQLHTVALIRAAGSKSALASISMGSVLNTEKCLSFKFLSAGSSQGRIHEHGSVGPPRHWLLHYVAPVKPLTPCHRGLSLSVSACNSHPIKAHCLCFHLHQRQVWLQNQVHAIHCCWPCWKRGFQSYWVHFVWKPTAVKPSEYTEPIQPEWDRNPLARWLYRLFHWFEVGLIVLFEWMCFAVVCFIKVNITL